MVAGQQAEITARIVSWEQRLHGGHSLAVQACLLRRLAGSYGPALPIPVNRPTLIQKLKSYVRMGKKCPTPRSTQPCAGQARRRAVFYLQSVIYQYVYVMAYYLETVKDVLLVVTMANYTSNWEEDNSHFSLNSVLILLLRSRVLFLHQN